VSATPAARGAGAGPAAKPKTARVAVLGAGGYAGSEFARLVLAHPGLTLDALVVRDPGLLTRGRPEEVLAGLDPRAFALAPPAVIGIEGLEARIKDGAVDTLVAALPHGVLRELAVTHPALLAAGAPVRVIDLSSDHRGGEGGFLYGLPEAFREELAGATRIANPGCYPTAFALALLPAAGAGWVGGPITVTALSGVSGAGRGGRLEHGFVEIDGGASYYKVGQVHAHVPEMERTLARLTLGAAPLGGVAFAPQLVPMARGILLTAHVPLARRATAEEAHALYAERYAAEPFVRVLPVGEWPATRAVRGSNRADVQVTTVFDGTVLLALAAIDNLAKGAATQALQNLNLMLGGPETTGLPRHGEPW